ncbi:hypothetical protein OG896_12025 [Streptomyces sp. NBC_00669]|uniref:CU044_2847 family protein n=1 Tax=unclassified Streptomyces TaxID=2593676 RepID=UPI002E1EFD52|nr:MULTISPECIES: CU044_2847 family protein [unclassified Streptomyces]
MSIVSGPPATSGAPPVYVQVEPGPAAVPGPVGPAEGVYSGETRGNPARRVAELSRDVYEDGIALACRCAEIAATRFRALPDGTRPDEVEMQVGIKLDASLGAYVVQSSAEAQLQVTFRWQSGTAS